MTYNTAAIRKLLIAAFSDEELTTFCDDHFHPVSELFSRGMTKAEKTQLLLDHCRRHGKMEHLLGLVKEANPVQYERYADRIHKIDTSARPSPDEPQPSTKTVRERRVRVLWGLYEKWERLETQHKIRIVVALIASVGSVLAALLGGPVAEELIRAWLSRPVVTTTPTEAVVSVNRQPIINMISISPRLVKVGSTATLTVEANDPDGDSLTYHWTADRGEVPPGPTGDPVVTYKAPSTPGSDTVIVTVSDGRGGTAEARVIISIVLSSATRSTVTPTETTIAIPTPAPTALATASPTAIATSTPMPTVTPTSAHTPTATPTSTSTPTPTPEYPTPILVNPPDASQADLIDQWGITLVWEWDRQLGPDEHFDVRVWREGDQEKAHKGIAWTARTNYRLGWQDLSSGKYFWSIAVIKGRNGKWEANLSDESEVWSFYWGRAQPSPTPTLCHGEGCPTPEPTPTLCHGQSCPFFGP